MCVYVYICFFRYIYIYTDTFGITWTITYLKKASQLKDLCSVILGYFGAHFGGVPLFIFNSTVKPYLIKICKDVFCVTPMFAALKKVFTASPPLLETILGYFSVCFVAFFLYFLRNVWFLMKFSTYILDKHSDGCQSKRLYGDCCPLFGAILSCVFLGKRGTHFKSFSLFLEKGSVCFHEILQRYS